MLEEQVRNSQKSTLSLIFLQILQFFFARSVLIFGDSIAQKPDKIRMFME